MKKIIATVLAMVMALALCATAFALSAADKAYDNKGNELKGDYTYEAVKATSSKKLDKGTIKHYDDGRHFLCRGKEKVTAEFALSALSYNIRRAIALCGGVQKLIERYRRIAMPKIREIAEI